MLNKIINHLNLNGYFSIDGLDQYFTKISDVYIRVYLASNYIEFTVFQDRHPSYTRSELSYLEFDKFEDELKKQETAALQLVKILKKESICRAVYKDNMDLFAREYEKYLEIEEFGYPLSRMSSKEDRDGIDIRYTAFFVYRYDKVESEVIDIYLDLSNNDVIKCLVITHGNTVGSEELSRNEYIIPFAEESFHIFLKQLKLNNTGDGDGN